MEDIILNAGGYGIRIDSGANNNLVAPRRLFDAALGGIRIDGLGTDNNVAGKFYRSTPFISSSVLSSLNFDSGGHGVHISGGASGNTVQMMNVSGHAGDGVLIEGTGTGQNRISAIFTGFQYFVKGTGLEPFAKPNTGNSLHLRDGAADNFIGSLNTDQRVEIDGIVNGAGILLDNAHGNQILGCFFGTPFEFADGEELNRNRIGGGNFSDRNKFDSNGVVADASFGFAKPSANPNAGGILIFGGQDNIIRNNEINNNGPQGIIIDNSRGNLIGGPMQVEGNQIIDTFGFPDLTTQNGIILRGSGTTLNVIQNNFIGTDTAGNNFGLTRNGIDISNSAFNNLIVGSSAVGLRSSAISVRTPNTIGHNGGHGVHVSGSGSTGNTILGNSIFGNGGLGIENEGSGNDELPPPVNMTLDGGGVSGEVDDVAVVPAGSIVNVFSDTGTQGAIFLGQTLVKAGGGWRLTGMPPPVFNNITATVTHVTSGSTSEFALAGTSRAFTIARTDAQAPSPQTVIFVNGKANVHFLTVEAVNDDVRVDGLTLKASDVGTLVENIELTGVSIYHDTNNDREITGEDSLLAGPVAFDADNGEVVIGLPGVVVEAGVPQQWIVRYEGNQSPPEGATFSLSVASALAVPAKFLFPFGADAAPLGSFPIASDEFTVGPAAASGNINDWRALHFSGISDQAFIGNNADPDHDGLTNLQEYALGTDPNMPDAQNATMAFFENSVLVFEFKRVVSASDVIYTVEFSNDLKIWDSEPGIIDNTQVFDNGDGTETVKVITLLQPDQISKKFARLQVDLKP